MVTKQLAELWSYFGNAFYETFQMVGISLSLAVIIGVPLGLFLFITTRGMFVENRLLNAVSGFIINVIRSVPFVILLVMLLPFTKLVVGTTIGSVAAAVPLSVAAVAFYARLVEASLREVDRGTIEAAMAMGATPFFYHPPCFTAGSATGADQRLYDYRDQPDRLLGDGRNCGGRRGRRPGNQIRLLPLSD